VVTKAQILADLIEKQGYSRRAFAEKAGIPATTLQSMLTRGIGGAAVDNVIKVCRALGITVEQLERMAALKAEPALDFIAVGRPVSIPIIGLVKAGPNGLAYEESLGFETAEEQDINGGRYFYLQVKGDSMIGEGIFEGDLALVREQPDVEDGELAVVIVDGEEGTLKRVYKSKGSIVLQAANPNYPPRTFVGSDMERVRIVGRVKLLKRKF